MIDIPRFIAAARSFENVNYHHQGRNRFGVDCIGLAIVALQEQGIHVEASADYSRTPKGDQLIKEIYDSGLVKRLPPTVPLEPGDILIFTLEQDPQHVGIVLDDTREMIHAAALVGKVRTVPLTPLWLTKLSHVFRWR